jgi:hypothetical protein
MKKNVNPKMLFVNETNSSVDIATRWTVGVRFRTRVRCSLLHGVHIGSGSLPASYPIDTGGNVAGA